MLKLFRKDSLTPQTERIYKVPLCIQDTIPIYRISENGIFELEGDWWSDHDCSSGDFEITGRFVMKEGAADHKFSLCPES